MLEFDPAAHKYTFNGQPVPNVTSVLSPLTSYAMVDPKKLEIARQKGVAIHKMVELSCQNDLDESSLPSWMEPALVQWKRFVAHSGFQVVSSETRVFHPIYKYAGTMDLFGNVAGQRTYIDVKRSFLAGAAIGYQIAAYAEAHSHETKGKSLKHKRFALRLREDGDFRLEPFNDPQDFNNFLTCLNFSRIKERHNVK